LSTLDCKVTSDILLYHIEKHDYYKQLVNCPGEETWLLKLPYTLIKPQKTNT